MNSHDFPAYLRVTLGLGTLNTSPAGGTGAGSRDETARIETARIELARIELARIEMARIEMDRRHAQRYEVGPVEADRPPDRGSPLHPGSRHWSDVDPTPLFTATEYTAVGDSPLYRQVAELIQAPVEDEEGGRHRDGWRVAGHRSTTEAGARSPGRTPRHRSA